jgi:hypothetical protein
MALGEQAVHAVTADEAGGAGDENLGHASAEIPIPGTAVASGLVGGWAFHDGIQLGESGRRAVASKNASRVQYSGFKEMSPWAGDTAKRAPGSTPWVCLPVRKPAPTGLEV